MALADEIAAWLGQEIDRVGAQGAAVGLSGGIDSAVVAGLAARGLGPERVQGLIMPIHSQARDVEDARLAAEAFGIPAQTIDLGPVYDLLLTLLPKGTPLAEANLKPRLRMLTLYFIANNRDLVVVGTGNRSELMVGYFTKYGDGGVDLLPLGSLLKRDVYEVARAIGVPQRIIERPPSAGLWAGQTDEAEMGVSYADLDQILAALAQGSTDGLEPQTVAKVQRMIAASEHKRHTPPIFQPGERP
ncbi:MAG TPA: NAD+ synthase [Thermomicrobiaceae bacterium]|nr:NAD+ synthase [Thermomicrobiaceae bacterium]